MDAEENAAVEVDLENAAVIETWPIPADPRLKEKEPFTWLRVAPWIVAMLAGVATVAVGMHLVLPCNAEQARQPFVVTTEYLVGAVLVTVGATLAAVGFGGTLILSDNDGDYPRNLPRFGDDDD